MACDSLSQARADLVPLRGERGSPGAYPELERRLGREAGRSPRERETVATNGKTTIVPPQNLEAEESVLGAMMVSESTIEPVLLDVRLKAYALYWFGW